MKTFRIALVSLTLLSCVAVSGFAVTARNDYVVTNFSATVADSSTVGSVTVAPNDAILAWFKAKGIDPATVTAPLGTLSKAQKDAIDTVYANSDNLSALDGLIQPLLKAALVRGSIENASMQLGRRVWYASIYGDEDR